MPILDLMIALNSLEKEGKKSSLKLGADDYKIPKNITKTESRKKL